MYAVITQMCILQIYFNYFDQFILVLFFLLPKSGLIFHISKMFGLFSILYFLYLDLQVFLAASTEVNSYIFLVVS